MVHSSSSFVIVQNGMSMAMMNDQIVETELAFIDEESTDPGNLTDKSIELNKYRFPTAENLNTIVTLKADLNEKPWYSFEVIRRNKQDIQTTRMVS